MKTCINCKKKFDNSLTTICPWCGVSNPTNDTIDKNSLDGDMPTDKIERSIHPSEKSLDAVADFILIFGIIAFAILLFTIVFVESSSYSSDIDFSPMGFGIALTTLLSSFIVRAIIKVIVLISINTRRTKEYLEDMYNKQQERK